MKEEKFIGIFIDAANVNKYELEVYCMSFFEAFFILTANAIKNGTHYQLHSITNEKGRVVDVGDIMKIKDILTLL